MDIVSAVKKFFKNRRELKIAMIVCVAVAFYYFVGAYKDLNLFKEYYDKGCAVESMEGDFAVLKCRSEMVEVPIDFARNYRQYLANIR